ncbi:MAG: VWA domain-containing protein [Acidobacteriota bacterium]
MESGRLRARGLVPLLLLAMLVTPAAGGEIQQGNPKQAPPPQFGASVDLVLVDVTVVDADGQFVPDLTAADFRVFEEGREVQVEFFALESFVPDFEAGAAATGSSHQAAAADGEAGSRRPEATAALTRYIVLCVDGLNTEVPDWLRIRPHLVRWVQQGLRPNDRVLLAYMGPDGRLRLTRGFSSDPTMLTGALMQIEANRDLAFGIREKERDIQESMAVENVGATTSPLDPASDVDIASLRQGAKLADIYARERRRDVLTGLDVLQSLAQHLADTYLVEGPKVVVLVSGGLPETPGLNYQLLVAQQAYRAGPTIQMKSGLQAYQPLTMSRSSGKQITGELIKALGHFNRLNYTFYTIDASGPFGADGPDLQSPNPTLTSTQRSEVEWDEQRGLVLLAEGTGGLAFTGTVNYERILQRIDEDTSYRYVLGYVPPPHDRKAIDKGKFYRIKVEVQRSGVKVRARQGYVDGQGGGK